jgi:hypothetical protein
MVLVQRNELKRGHTVYVLAAVLAPVVLVGAIAGYSGRSPGAQIALVLLATGAVATFILAALQLLTSPKRSQALVFYRDDGIVLATNALHEGFKLRFLRDILAENVSSFTDDERARWKEIEADGFYAGLYIRGARRVVVLRLCTMIFDDVFVGDQFGRWDYYDASCTSEPAFASRVTPPLKSWKGIARPT